jgi:hypothetical protein
MIACVRLVFLGVAALVSVSLLHSEFLTLNARPLTAHPPMTDDTGPPLDVPALRTSLIN